MEITKKPIVTYPILYDLSINIYSILSGINNYVIAGWSNKKNCKKYKLYSNKKGDYFCINRQRYYLNDFIRLE